MNYYARYFDSEGVFHTPNELVNFIASLPPVMMTDSLSNAILKFCEEKTSYPRHFRLPNKHTFIVIKTNARSLDEFKTVGANGGVVPPEVREAKNLALEEICPGKYRVNYTFRRAIVNPETNKCSFVEEPFEVEMLAQSPKQCYEVVLEYLKNHPDLDIRCQFPSMRSGSFAATLIKE